MFGIGFKSIIFSVILIFLGYYLHIKVNSKSEPKLWLTSAQVYIRTKCEVGSYYQEILVNTTIPFAFNCISSFNTEYTVEWTFEVIKDNQHKQLYLPKKKWIIASDKGKFSILTTGTVGKPEECAGDGFLDGGIIQPKNEADCDKVGISQLDFMNFHISIKGKCKSVCNLVVGYSTFNPPINKDGPVLT